MYSFNSASGVTLSDQNVTSPSCTLARSSVPIKALSKSYTISPPASGGDTRTGISSRHRPIHAWASSNAKSPLILIAFIGRRASASSSCLFTDRLCRHKVLISYDFSVHVLGDLVGIINARTVPACPSMTLSLISALLAPPSPCVLYVASAIVPLRGSGSDRAHTASSFSTSSRSKGTVLATETEYIGNGASRVRWWHAVSGFSVNLSSTLCAPPAATMFSAWFP